VFSQFIVINLLSNPKPEVSANLEPNFFSFIRVSAVEAAAQLQLNCRLTAFSNRSSMLKQFCLFSLFIGELKAYKCKLRLGFFSIYVNESL
jgi:hypothetical protein